jgi:alpha-1,2-mannosyltransferase
MDSMHFWRTRGYDVLLAVFCFGMLFVVLNKERSDWHGDYVPAAERLLDGDDIIKIKYTYPPAFALLCLPFVGLSHYPARLLWFAIIATATYVMYRSAWVLAGGKRGAEATTVDHRAFMIGSITSLPFMLDSWTNFQTDTLIVALCLGGCVQIVRGRSLLGGLIIGFAAACKCTPLLFAPYLLWRRNFVAALAVIVGAVGFNLLPDVIHLAPGGKSHLRVWAEKYLFPMAEKQRDLAEWPTGVDFNHSVAGVTLRWGAFDPIFTPGDRNYDVKDNRLDQSTIKRIGMVVSLGLLLSALLVTLRRPAATPSPEVFPPWQSLEFGMVLLLMVLLSPVSSKPHFVANLLAGVTLARIMLITRDKLLSLLVGLAVVLSLAVNKDLVGNFAYRRIVWLGGVTGTTVLLYAASLYARVRWPGWAPSVAGAETGR